VPVVSWLPPILVMSVLLVGCTVPGPTVAAPEVAGTVIAVDHTGGGLIDHYRLQTGAIVTVDRNNTIVALRTTPEVKARDLILAGKIPEGDWVMEIGEGTLAGRADIGCYGLTLDALDADRSVIFQVEPTRTTDPRWRLRLSTTPGFGWQRGGQPRSDGTYVGGTTFCLNGRGEVTGQLPQ
jgi:hypothetical protein